MSHPIGAKVLPTSAAIYLRVSTENQDYSTDHQRSAIERYSEAQDLRITAEYIDEGRSGLDIRRRSGLRNLISDVQSGEAPFTVIVVYDVSRWGRFQDIDEAAYYEHTCRRAGIRVVYCAEQFQNDGSPLASLLKGIKRTMAAEYSRELSAKVFDAQCRFVGMGYKQGGHAGYGLRRLSLAADGTPRRELLYGESKGTVTDRVVLTLGPAHEVETVRRIYALYVDGAGEAAIARLLNAEGIASEFSRPWTQAMINSILTNTKYDGTLAFNRRSSKLASPRQHNDTSAWIVKGGAVPLLLAPALFNRAQVERAKRNRRYPPGELLALLRGCHAKHGKVTASVIAADPILPDPQLFKRAFGSLTAAYDQAGLPQTKQHTFVSTKRLLLDLQRTLFSKVCESAAAAGATVAVLHAPHTLLLNGSVVTRVVVTPRRKPVRGFANWAVKPKPGIHFTIAARYDPDVQTAVDYFLLSSEVFGGRPIYLKALNGVTVAASRYEQVEYMFATGDATPA
jgi:DNA invertase Pin-like site-specific DNA recombinase